jgi:hypothetical protein
MSEGQGFAPASNSLGNISLKRSQKSERFNGRFPRVSLDIAAFRRNNDEQTAATPASLGDRVSVELPVS